MAESRSADEHDAISRFRCLVALKELIEASKVTPDIDRTYPLSVAAEAQRYIGQGHTRGKVAITV